MWTSSRSRRRASRKDLTSAGSRRRKNFSKPTLSIKLTTRFGSTFGKWGPSRCSTGKARSRSPGVSSGDRPGRGGRFPGVPELIARLRAAVDELKPLELHIARNQRAIEAAAGSSVESVRELRREQRLFAQAMQDLEERYGSPATELRRALELVNRSDREAENARQELIEAN